MAFVIDASATLPWRFADEATPWTEALLDRIEAGEEARSGMHDHDPLVASVYVVWVDKAHGRVSF